MKKYRTVLIAECQNEVPCSDIAEEPVQCPGTLRFGWGMVQAACDICGARCGISVAAWVRVEVY